MIKVFENRQRKRSKKNSSQSKRLPKNKAGDPQKGKREQKICCRGKCIVGLWQDDPVAQGKAEKSKNYGSAHSEWEGGA